MQHRRPAFLTRKWFLLSLEVKADKRQVAVGFGIAAVGCFAVIPPTEEMTVPARLQPSAHLCVWQALLARFGGLVWPTLVVVGSVRLLVCLYPRAHCTAGVYEDG